MNDLVFLFSFWPRPSRQEICVKCYAGVHEKSARATCGLGARVLSLQRFTFWNQLRAARAAEPNRKETISTGQPPASFFLSRRKERNTKLKTLFLLLIIIISFVWFKIGGKILRRLVIWLKINYPTSSHYVLINNKPASPFGLNSPWSYIHVKIADARMLYVPVGLLLPTFSLYYSPLIFIDDASASYAHWCARWEFVWSLSLCCHDAISIRKNGTGRNQKTSTPPAICRPSCDCCTTSERAFNFFFLGTHTHTHTHTSDLPPSHVLISHGGSLSVFFFFDSLSLSLKAGR